MIAGLLKVLLKVLVAAAAVALVLTIVGDSLREIVPEAYRRALWLTGLFISVPCAVAAVLLAKFAPGKARLRNLLVVGVVIGALLYLLFVTGVDCTLTPSHGRSARLRVDCRDVG